MVKPDILIVDEILAVGDIKFRQKCMERMDQMLADGTTLIYVSHNLKEVRRLCDHAIWINKGEEVMQGEVNEVCDAYINAMNK
jgi:lipopolysaccharide transport system ATP-binding protein